MKWFQIHHKLLLWSALGVLLLYRGPHVQAQTRLDTITALKQLNQEISFILFNDPKEATDAQLEQVLKALQKSSNLLKGIPVSDAPELECAAFVKQVLAHSISVQTQVLNHCSTVTDFGVFKRIYEIASLHQSNERAIEVASVFSVKEMTSKLNIFNFIYSIYSLEPKTPAEILSLSVAQTKRVKLSNFTSVMNQYNQEKLAKSNLQALEAAIEYWSKL